MQGSGANGPGLGVWGMKSPNAPTVPTVPIPPTKKPARFQAGFLLSCLQGSVGFLQLDVLVAAHAGACGDELADDDVLLQALQGVHLALDGGLG